MTRLVPDLVNGLLTFLPMEAVIGVGVVLFLVAIPFWLNSVRLKQINGAVRRMVRATPEERTALRERALELAGEKTMRIEALANACLKYGEHDLRKEAMRRLAAVNPAVAAEVRKKTDKPPLKHRDVLEAVTRIEMMLDGELFVGAREQLDAAKKRFGDHDELAPLEERLIEMESQ